MRPCCHDQTEVTKNKGPGASITGLSADGFAVEAAGMRGVCRAQPWTRSCRLLRKLTAGDASARDINSDQSGGKVPAYLEE